ncbi:thiamine-phosphate kinase [Desulfovibrio sp.]
MPLNSEDAFLARIEHHFPPGRPLALLERGDDCALLDVAGGLLATSDLFLEDVHFRRSYFAPEDIGHKALAVNLSDIAAMGGKALAFTLSLMVPPGPGEEFWDGVLAGMAALAKAHGVHLAGGDLSRAETVGLDICALGRPGPAGRVLARGGCRPGDALFVVGDLGLARAGLLILERDGLAAREQWPVCCAAHLRPEPRLAEGLALAESGLARGLMGVSDGLARDLPRLLGPDLGADLDLAAGDLHPELTALAGTLGQGPLELALRGGEDYALLGVAALGDLEAILKLLPGARAIGAVSERPGLRLNGVPVTVSGHDHFSAPAGAGLRLAPIGRVRSPLASRDQAPKCEDEDAPRAWIDLDPALLPALDGLEAGQKIQLLTWLHLADRSVLRVHPRGNRDVPKRGVLATRSPDRPNPIGLHEVTILEIKGTSLLVDGLEAVDGTPVVDVKPALKKRGK